MQLDKKTLYCFIDKFVCELYYIIPEIFMNQSRRDDIIFLIKYLGKLLDKDLDARLSEFDLTGQQGRILFYIAKRTNICKLEVHQNDIEQEFHLSKSTVSGLVKRMEKKGVISIEKQHPYAVLKPSEKGECIIHQLIDKKTDVDNKLMSGLTKEQQTILKEELNKLIENMEGGN